MKVTDTITTRSGTSHHRPALRGVEQGWTFPQGKQTPYNPIVNPSAGVGGCSNHPADPLPQPLITPLLSGERPYWHQCMSPQSHPSQGTPILVYTAKNHTHTLLTPGTPADSPSVGRDGWSREKLTSPGHISLCDYSETGVKTHLQLNSAGGNSPLSSHTAVALP